MPAPLHMNVPRSPPSKQVPPHGEPQDPQCWLLLFVFVSQPLDQLLSQLPKPSSQVKAQVPVAQERLALGGATQALLQQTPSTHWREWH
jgi:hypothetical protein